MGILPRKRLVDKEERRIPPPVQDWRFPAPKSYEEVSTPSLADLARYKGLIRDPKDLPVAVSAINVKVDYLVTQDRDFTDQDESTIRLREMLNILLPGTFLREHMGWTSDALEAIRERKWSDLT